MNLTKLDAPQAEALCYVNLEAWTLTDHEMPPESREARNHISALAEFILDAPELFIASHDIFAETLNQNDDAYWQSAERLHDEYGILVLPMVPQAWRVLVPTAGFVIDYLQHNLDFQAKTTLITTNYTRCAQVNGWGRMIFATK